MTEQTLEKNKKKIKISNLHEIGLLIALILVLLLFSFTTENFFTQRNFTSILRSASYVGFIAFPMTFVLITREIDISVGPSVAWSGLFFVILIKFKIKNIMPKVPIKVNIREEETILSLK